MLSSLRLVSVRNALVILLMALSAVVAVQRSQSTINDIQHASSIDHPAPVSELKFTSALDDHGLSADRADQDSEEDRSGDHDPASHHHHAEGPQVAHVATATLEPVVQMRSAAMFAEANDGAPRFLTFGLKRPPKARSNPA
uniref:hypothetical protein n=1 Tax=uncultured Caulobacter sp. TaxID=158749 RepID=UPI0025E29028|nr:hypothetical protein [uncultured Caulobacter sp.]